MNRYFLNSISKIDMKITSNVVKSTIKGPKMGPKYSYQFLYLFLREGVMVGGHIDGWGWGGGPSAFH